MRYSPTRIYFFLIGAISLGMGLMFTMSNVYRVGAGLTPMQLVLVGTMLELSVFFFEIPTGIVADVYSRKISVIIGYALIGLGFILEAAIPWVVTIWLAQWVWGIGYTFTSGAREAWLADEIGEENLTRVYLRAAQVGQVMSLVGVGAATLLATVQLNLPMLLGGGVLVATAVALAFTMPETGFQPTPREERTTWGQMWHIFREGGRVVRRSPLLMTIFAISLCIGLASEGLDRFWEAHFLTNFTLPSLGALDSVAWFGIMQLVTTFLVLGLTEWLRRRNTEDDQTAVRILFALKLLMIGGIFAFAWAGNFGMAIAAYWTTFVFRSLTGPIYGAWLTRQVAPQVRATVLSMHGQMDSLGQIASGPFMGVIATVGSLRWALTAVGGLWMAVLPLLYRAGRQSRP
jgi:MFS transporter, DHA3 family, tetracycline resistance protein